MTTVQLPEGFYNVFMHYLISRWLPRISKAICFKSVLAMKKASNSVYITQSRDGCRLIRNMLILGINQNPVDVAPNLSLHSAVVTHKLQTSTVKAGTD